MAKRHKENAAQTPNTVEPTLTPVGFMSFDDEAHPGDTDEAHSEHQPAHSTTPETTPNTAPNTATPTGLPAWPANPPSTFLGWIHPATDNKGHDTKITLKVMPAVARQMSLAVASKQFPYRTVQELIRHAVYQHLDWLTTLNTNVPSVMAQIDSINTLIADEQLLLEQNDVLARHLAITEQHIRMGDYASAERIVNVALTQLQHLPPGAWRESYLQRFQEMYRLGKDLQRSNGNGGKQ